MAYSYNTNEQLITVQIDKNGQDPINYWSQINARSGRSVPGFEKLISQKSDASSAYSRTKTYVRQWVPWIQSSHSTSVPPVFNTVTTSEALYWGTTTLLSETNESQEALRKFYQSLADSKHSFNGAQFIAEFGGLKKLVASRANTLWSLVKRDTSAFKREADRLRYRDKQPFRRVAKRLSDRWLEYSFGWSPLMNDISDARKAWDNEFDVTSIKVRGSHTTSDVLHAIRNDGATPCNWRSHRRTVRTVQARYVAAYAPECSPMTNWGLNVGSIGAGIWAGIPWSFLADYFVDIGTFLNQHQYASMNFVYISKSLRRRNRMSVLVTPRATSTSKTIYSSGGNSVIDIVNYQRTPLQGLPTYWPAFNIAGPLKGFRLWNIGALLGSRVRPW